jgi:flagellar biosynthesis component FlhA
LDVVLVVSPTIRMRVYRLLERKVPDFPILSYCEVSDDVDLRVLVSIRTGTAVAPAA